MTWRPAPAVLALVTGADTDAGAHQQAALSLNQVGLDSVKDKAGLQVLLGRQECEDWAHIEERIQLLAAGLEEGGLFAGARDRAIVHALLHVLPDKLLDRAQVVGRLLHRSL